MKNPRLKGVVEKFCEQYNIDGELGTKYQSFVNYLLLNRSYYRINQAYPFKSAIDTTLLNAIDFDTNSENGMAVDGFFSIYNGEIFHLDMEIDEIGDKMNSISSGVLIILT